MSPCLGGAFELDAKVRSDAIQGLTKEEARDRFWICDKDGLVTTKRDPASTMDVVKPFARKADECIEGESLADIVYRVRS